MRAWIANMSLGRRLIWISCLCVLLPLIVASVLLYQSAVEAYSQVNLRAGELSLRQAAEAIEAACKQAIRAADTVVADQRLMAMMARPADDYPAAQRLDDLVEIQAKLIASQTENAVSSIRLVWAHPVQWLSNNGVASLSLARLDQMLSENGVSRADKPYLTPQWLPHNELPASEALFTYRTIAYARMIRNIADFDQLLGYVVVLQTRDQYETMLRRADLSGKALLALCDASGAVIARGGQFQRPDALFARYADAGMPKERFTFEGSAVLPMEATLPTTGWRIVQLMPLGEYQDNVFLIFLRTVGLVVLLTCLALLLARLMLKGILWQIDRIIGSMERVERGDFAAKLPAVSANELGRIESHFNRMVEHIGALLSETRDMAARDRLLHIRLLQTQINPHFLYNTINSILWTAMDYGADRTVQMLKALSDFYKIGLQPGREETTVECELMHAERYVTLQNLRGKTQVRLTVLCDEALYETNVPNMMLQPLVENSMLHGFADRESGSLTIRVWREGASLLIETTDDGSGMSDAACEEMLAHMLPGHAYGLYSIRERLKLRYGETAELRLFPNPGGGVTARITLPVAEG